MSWFSKGSRRSPRLDRVAVRVAVRVADWFNPFVGGASGPLSARGLFASLAPSLMPRATLHQGIASGLSVLAAEAVGETADRVVRIVVPPSAPFPLRIGARAAILAGGGALARIPETDDEPTARAALRSAGDLAVAAAIGGIISESVMELRRRFPPTSPARPVLTGLGVFAGAMFYANRLLARRQAVVKRWTEDDAPATMPGTFAVGAGVAWSGRGIAKAFSASQRGLVRYFGKEDPIKATVGRALNAALWVGGGVAAYTAGVASIARSNEVLEPAYSTPPTSPYVSGGPASISPFEELGLQGRRYVSDVITPDEIEATLGEPAVAHPIRAYVGVNSEPLYPSGRSEMLLDELDALGAWDRSYLLLISPTGTGWVDQTMIEAAELFARGDIASACVQYGRGPSFLELQKVHLGRAQFRGVLWGVRQRLLAMPEDRRPKVLVFGESLGAWSASDVVMHQGIAGFDHYGIDRALWFGLPGFAKWSKTGMAQGASDLVPPGTVAAFDRFEQFEALAPEDRDRLRAIVVDHDNDPIAQISLRWAVKEPPWLRGERGRNVPEGMDWVPLVTFVQLGVDAMNAMKTIPGEFKSFGHDYRADTPPFVHAAFRLPPVTDDQMAAVYETLRRIEVERAERIRRSNELLKQQKPQRVARRMPWERRRRDPR